MEAKVDDPVTASVPLTVIPSTVITPRLASEVVAITPETFEVSIRVVVE